LKVAIDCRLYSQTGVGRYIRAILATLKREATETQKIEYFLIVYEPDLKYFSDFPPNIKIIPTSAKWHSFREQLTIPKILWKNIIDFVHFPYFNVPIFTTTKFIVTVHDLTINKFKTGKATSLPKPLFLIKKILYLLTMWLAVKRAKKVLTVSNTVKEEIKKAYGIEDNKIKVVYNGGELEEDTDGNGDRGNMGNKGKHEKYILYVGNLHPHKNVETLILAYDQLIKEEKYKNIKLIIISPFDFFYKKIFLFLKNLKLENVVEFTGPIDNNKLVLYYQHASCLVFPSLSEGFGIPGVEAMNFGCPVIASDLPIFHEIYDEAALFFNPKNALDLKEKIELAVANTNLRSRLYLRGMDQAKKYSWEKMGGEIVKVYESMSLREA
jgi:glycosyltransferase involved in cell wall biosynthesis